MCLFFFRRKKKKEKAVEPAKKPVVEESVQAVEPVNSKPVAEEVVKKVETAPVKPKAAVVEPKVSKVKEVVRIDNGNVLVKARYNRSHTAKLIQGDEKLKRYYSEIKNELLRYKVKNRISWRYETFKKGRKLIARLAVRGKTLGLYLALDPKEYEDSEYKIDDVSKVVKNAEVPLIYKIKNDRRCRYSKELIAEVMEANGLDAGKVPTEDYASQYPYEKIGPLIERGLVKLLKWNEKGESAEEGLIEIAQTQYEQLTAEEEQEKPIESVSVAEAEERMADEEAEAFVKTSERLSDKTKKDIVNIDALGKYFKSGERVTVDEIVKRVPSVNKKATYIKVLARGTLDKPLDIEADDFSPAAIKMIVLTGGTVSRTKNS